MGIGTTKSAEFCNTIGDIAAGNDRIAQGNAIAVMTGEEKAFGRVLDFIEQLPVAAITDVVLRDGFGKKGGMLKNWFSSHTQQGLEVGHRQLDQSLRGHACQLGISFTSDVAGEREMASRRAIRK